MPRLLGCLAGLLIACGFAQGLHAETFSRLAVERASGAEDCPDALSLSEKLARFRGRKLDRRSTPYQVLFERDAETVSATIRDTKSTTQRVIRTQSVDCASLTEATTVTLALLLDSDAAAEPSPTLAKAAPQGEPTSTRGAKAQPMQGTRPRVTLSVAGGGIAGVIGPIAPFLGVEAGLAMPRLRLGLGALWALAPAIEFGPGEVTESLQSGTARACFGVGQSGAPRIDLCSGVLIGRVVARADGYTLNEERTRAWLAVPLELALAHLSGPIGWELAASGLAPLVRDDFVIDGLGVVYHSTPVALSVTLRAVAVLPW